LPEVSIGRPPPSACFATTAVSAAPSAAYSRLREDLERMELRRRRIHDTHRTMIMVALNDGARRDVLQGITPRQQGRYHRPLQLAALVAGTVLGTVGSDAEEFRDLMSSDDRTRIP
jgi:hypothetical protein